MKNELKSLSRAELDKECHRRRRQCASGYACGSASIALAVPTSGLSLVPTLLYTLPRTMYMHGKNDEIETEYKRRKLQEPSISTGDILVPMIVGAASFGIGAGAEGMGLADHAANAIHAAPDASNMIRDAILSVGATPAFPIEQATELANGVVDGAVCAGEAVKSVFGGAINLVSDAVTTSGNALGQLYNEPIADLVGITAGVAIIEEGVVLVGEKMRDLYQHPKGKSS